MTTPDDGTNEELTEREAGLLDEIRGLYTEIDPMPAHLAALSRFAMELEETDFELARPDPHRELAGTASRGHDQTQYIPFDGDLLTMIVSVQRNDDDSRRVDGHIAPAGAHLVQLRTNRGTLETESNEDGRFTINQVPAGPAQLIVRIGATAVISPALQV